MNRSRLPTFVVGSALVLSGCAAGSSPTGPSVSASHSSPPNARVSANDADDASGPVSPAQEPDADVSDAPPRATTAAAPASTGSIAFHLLLGVGSPNAPGDALTLDGDKYTDLIMSNFIAGAVYSHLIQAYSPGIHFEQDYLVGSLFAQLLQENIATEYYSTSSPLIDSSPDQQGVMGVGQGGPYQINNYAADMVYGSYAPMGYSLINYVALQKNIGYDFAAAPAQHDKATPAAFNDKYYGPVLAAYFHFNDYVALHQIGPVGGYLPQWQPEYDNALANFKVLPTSFLDILLNVAYNQGYYGPLVTSYSHLGASATVATVAGVDGYGSIWGVDDTYRQYPYQVRYYLDQLYDKPIPTTSPTATIVPNNHVRFGVAALGATFAAVFQTLAYVDGSSGYVFIGQGQAMRAFDDAVAQSALSSYSSLDMSDAQQRSQIFALLEAAIGGLETSLGTSLAATTSTSL